MYSRISQIPKSFAELLNVSSAQFQFNEGNPKPNSVAENEGNHSGDSGLKTIQGQGIMLIELAGDHISATIKTVAEPVETVASWTCVRAVLETSAVAAWLFDPAIGWKERVQRSIALRFEGLEQQIKFARSVGAKETSISLMSARLTHMAEQAAMLGFEPIKNKNGRVVGAGLRMPSTTELVETVLGQGSTYRATSAVVHGHFWAVSHLCFAEDASKQQRVKEKGFAAAMAKSLSPVSALYLYVSAARSFGHALWNQFRYYGWDFQPVQQVIAAHFDELGVAEEHYFWRPSSRA